MQSRYVEVHMEQGPVLEALGQPLGVVTAIAGQSRLGVTMKGTQVSILISLASLSAARPTATPSLSCLRAAFGYLFIY